VRVKEGDCEHAASVRAFPSLKFVGDNVARRRVRTGGCGTGGERITRATVRFWVSVDDQRRFDDITHLHSSMGMRQRTCVGGWKVGRCRAGGCTQCGSAHGAIAYLSRGDHLDVEVIHPTALALSFKCLDIELEGTLRGTSTFSTYRPLPSRATTLAYYRAPWLAKAMLMHGTCLSI